MSLRQLTEELRNRSGIEVGEPDGLEEGKTLNEGFRDKEDRVQDMKHWLRDAPRLIQRILGQLKRSAVISALSDKEVEDIRSVIAKAMLGLDSVYRDLRR